MSKKYKVCVAGWTFPKNLYKQLSISSLDIFIVAHKYNKVLDDLKLNYKIIKNIGRECHIYDWYIKNIWDKKSDVLFMHDDVRIKKFDKSFILIFKKAKGLDISFIMGGKENKFKTNSGRCMYYSSKLIKLYLKEYNGIWYDIHNKGYTFNTFEHYDSYIYNKKYKKYMYKEGRDFVLSRKALIKKYKLKWKNIIDRKIILYRRGGKMNTETYEYILNDNSIFGRKGESLLENLSSKYKIDKGRHKHFYTKWYEFYFGKIRLDNLSVLEIGTNNRSLKIWKKYFKNSDVYNINEKGLFLKNNLLISFSDQIDEFFLKKVLSKIILGFDIVIDADNRLIENRKRMFELIFDKMNPGGVYVLENLHLTYERNNIELINFIKNKMDDINFKGKYENNSFEKNYVEDMTREERIINGIAMYSGICFIFKRFCK